MLVFLRWNYVDSWPPYTITLLYLLGHKERVKMKPWFSCLAFDLVFNKAIFYVDRQPFGIWNASRGYLFRDLPCNWALQVWISLHLILKPMAVTGNEIAEIWVSSSKLILSNTPIHRAQGQYQSLESAKNLHRKVLFARKYAAQARPVVWC